MKAALLPDRGVVKVVGDDARKFLNGLLTADMDTVSPENARFAALLTPQGKIVMDCIVAEAAPDEGGGFFIDCPRALAPLSRPSSISTSCAPRSLWRICRKCSACSRSGMAYRHNRVRPLLRGSPSGRTRSARHDTAASGQESGRRSRRRRWWMRRNTKHTGLRSACRAAAAISPTAMRFRTKPTWTSLPASISTRAATSARKSCRACSTAAHARTRIVAANTKGPRRKPASPVMAGEKNLGTFGSGRERSRHCAGAHRPRCGRARGRHADCRRRRAHENLASQSWARFDFADSTKAAE